MGDAADTQMAIIDLQMKLSFQDELLEELNQVMTQQQHQIMRLETRVERLQSQLETLQAAPQAGELKEPPPPHY